MIHPSTIEEIKNRLDIVEVVGDFVTLKRAGSSFRALSPFTNEKTPSFYVVPSKGIFKDFSSGKGGDAISFVMEVDGLSYAEALKYLAGKYGIEVKEDQKSDEALEAQNKRESLSIVLNFAKEYYKRLLHESDEGKSIGLTYFKERGFTDETIHKFELGFALPIWDGLLKEAVKKEYSKDLLEEAGLVTFKEEKGYDRFRDRVIFPIHNISGKPIAFGGRKLSKNDKSAKYINSPETELYNKSKVLYGLFQSKNAIRKEDNCFLVEGYTDVISMHQSGVENVVSSSGTALTTDQVKLIRRYTQNITVIFDGDQAGIKASLRGIDMLLEGDMNVRAVALPEGQDPDSYSQQLGGMNFRDFISEESQDIIQFKTKVLIGESGGDPVKKAAVIKDIIASIVKISDPVKRTLYIKETSNLLGIEESILISEQNKLLFQNNKQQAPLIEDTLPVDHTEEIIQNLDISKIIESQEEETIRILINHSNRYLNSTVNKYLPEYYLDELDYGEMDGIQFINPVYKEIFEAIRNAGSYEAFDISFLMDNVSAEAKQVIVDLSTNQNELSPDWKSKHNIEIPTEIIDTHLRNVAKTNVLRWKFRLVQKMIEDLLEILKRDKDTSEINEEPLDEILALKNIQVEIAKSLGIVLFG